MKTLGRVRQFWRAVRAKVRDEDLEFMRAHVPEQARPFFLGMHPADQVHALNVARTVLELAAGEAGGGADQELLLRCALLHDIGRQRGSMDVWGKVLAVLADKWLPEKLWQKFLRTEGKALKEKPGYALYVYREHPRLGAAMLESVGLREEAGIILRHHEPMREGEPAELVLLRRADALN